MNNRKTALILGMGQDGIWLSKLLLSKGYRVLGGVRRISQPRDYLIPLIEEGLEIIECDVTDSHSVHSTVEKYKPEYLYNTSAMSHVHTSFNSPNSTFEINTLGVINILEAIRNVSPKTRLYQCSTSELFGSSYSLKNKDGSIHHFNINKTNPEKLLINSSGEWIGKPFQDENTPLSGQSPYGISKLAAHEMVRLYRESYQIFAVSAFIFNHESQYRTPTFVTRKITRYIGDLVGRLNRKQENIPKLKLGNLNAYRDWSHAKDIVRAMVLILESDKPDDYVVGSGETHTVREFAQKAFAIVNLNWEDYIEVDEDLKRPAEVDFLRSNPTKIKEKLGWKPEISFDELIQLMVRHDIKEQSDIRYLNSNA